jgi:large subunit ribosomal protein L25
MAKAIKVVAEVRAGAGSSVSRRLRRTGVFPGVVYGTGKTPCNVQVNQKAFLSALGGHVNEHVILDLEIQGQDVRKVLLQDVQHHPITDQVLHADFHEISMTEKLRIEIPVHLVGEPVGVTQSGGVLEHLLRAITVECLPTDIVESFNVDVAGLQIGDKLSAGDIALDAAKYTLITSKDLAIASVSAPREEEVKAEVTAETAAEPEVIKEKKEEGEGEAAGKDAGKDKGGGKPAAAKDAKPAAKPAAKDAKK